MESLEKQFTDFLIRLEAIKEAFNPTYSHVEPEPEMHNNEIWYTTTDGNICDPIFTDQIEPEGYIYTGPTLVSNVYKNGFGIMTFSEDLTSTGFTEYIEDKIIQSGPIFAYFEDFPEIQKNINLKSIILPDSIEIIGSTSFCSLPNLEIIENINFKDNIVFKDECISECPNLDTIQTNDTIIHCKQNVTEFIVPEGITTIFSDAFHGCTQLQTISLPNSLIQIQFYAFYNCSSLETITIPNSVTTIGMYTFYDCIALTSISYTGTISEWKSITKGNYWHQNVPAIQVTCSDGNTDLD